MLNKDREQPTDHHTYDMLWSSDAVCFLPMAIRNKYIFSLHTTQLKLSAVSCSIHNIWSRYDSKTVFPLFPWWTRLQHMTKASLFPLDEQDCNTWSRPKGEFPNIVMMSRRHLEPLIWLLMVHVQPQLIHVGKVSLADKESYPPHYSHVTGANATADIALNRREHTDPFTPAPRERPCTCAAAKKIILVSNDIFIHQIQNTPYPEICKCGHWANVVFVRCEEALLWLASCETELVLLCSVQQKRET